MRTFEIVRMLCIVVVLNIFTANAVITEFTGEELETIITTHALDFDFIMIDIRDNMEVEEGIIASEYCKPYHLSWNYNEFSEHYNEIPKDLAVIVYCRSGSRARSAVKLLSNDGFETVGTLKGGINAYGGELKDSTEFKPVSDLPEPSYLGEPPSALIMPFSKKNVKVSRVGQEPLLYTVTLAGKVISSEINRNLLPSVIIDCYKSSAEKSAGRMLLFKKK